MKSEKGFTLIELLIAMVIIGFLIAGVAVLASNVQRNSRDTRRKQIAEGVYGAAQDYIGNFNANPTSFALNSATGELVVTGPAVGKEIRSTLSPLPGQTNVTLTVGSGIYATDLSANCNTKAASKTEVVLCYSSTTGSTKVQIEAGAGGYLIK